MRPTTHTIIQAALDSDQTVSPDERQELLRILSGVSPLDLVSEPEAARLLGISQSALNAQRHDLSRPFPYTTYPVRNAAGEVYAIRYNRHQILSIRGADAIPPRPPSI